MLVVEDGLEIGFRVALVRRQEDAVPVENALEAVEPVENQDVGIEVIDSLGAMAVGDVLERRPLHGGAELDQPMLEDPRAEVFDRQIADVMMLSNGGRDRGRALRHHVGEDDVKHGLGMNPLDRVGQRRRLGQVIRRDASEYVHVHSFAPRAVSPRPSDRSGAI